MGTSSSSCMETPVKVVYNKHLGNVLDPRSPTAGILRTPIEVLGSPGTPDARVELDDEEEEGEEVSGSLDPRSPTPGVSRTPLKPSVTDKFGSLTKQLSGMFIGPESGTQRGDGDPSEVKGADQLLDCEEEEKEEARDTDLTPQPGHPQEDQEDPVSARVWLQDQRPTSKLVQREAHPLSNRGRRNQPGRPQLVSAKGRCPLQVLKDDNSPTCALARRQVKVSLGSSGSPSELIPRTLLKLGQSPADKENHRSQWLSGEVRACPP
ncbi:cell division cycle-associated protein 3 [Pristis pectinata]|uniref:cell division cycle-associated protein 3 n=1 Tax=Pristis pectinata TaxID=685728 RepID=UPI00223D530B|nr:cell division cycle-associated protein 3 [Pristis pectinata]